MCVRVPRCRPLDGSCRGLGRRGALRDEHEPGAALHRSPWQADLLPAHTAAGGERCSWLTAAIDSEAAADGDDDADDDDDADADDADDDDDDDDNDGDDDDVNRKLERGVIGEIFL